MAEINKKQEHPYRKAVNRLAESMASNEADVLFRNKTQMVSGSVAVASSVAGLFFPPAFGLTILAVAYSLSRAGGTDVRKSVIYDQAESYPVSAKEGVDALRDKKRPSGMDENNLKDLEIGIEHFDQQYESLVSKLEAARSAAKIAKNVRNVLGGAATTLIVASFFFAPPVWFTLAAITLVTGVIGSIAAAAVFHKIGMTDIESTKGEMEQELINLDQLDSQQEQRPKSEESMGATPADLGRSSELSRTSLSPFSPLSSLPSLSFPSELSRTSLPLLSSLSSLSFPSELSRTSLPLLSSLSFPA